jgi:hypothetical protein
MPYAPVVLSVVIALGAMAAPLHAQLSTAPDESATMLRISIVPGLSTGDSHSISNISFSLLGGRHGAFRWLEMASVFNINRYDVRGVQLAGILNLDHRVARGFIAAPVNVTGSQAGLQLGVLNVTGERKGTQIGLINVVREAQAGASIGLLSFVRGGRVDASLWTNETRFINAGVRVGTERVYNTLSLGSNRSHDEHLWQVGLGLGYHHRLGSGSALETDIMHAHVNHGGWTAKNNDHTQARVVYVHRVGHRKHLFTGPSLNLLVADSTLPAPFVRRTFSERTSGANILRWWTGWTFGIIID